MNFFDVKTVVYNCPHTSNLSELGEDLNSSLVLKNEYKKFEHLLEDIQLLKSKNITNANFKVISGEISVSSARQCVLFSSFNQLWDRLNKSNLSLNNYHEKFSDKLDHCVYTGVFFDIDLKQEGSEEERKTRYAEIITLTQVLIEAIKQVLLNINDNDNFMVQIQDASSENKISLHGIIKQSDLIFTSIYQIKAIILESIYICLTTHEKKMFSVDSFYPSKQKEKGKPKKWIDLQIYNDGKTFRCLYSAKKSNPSRILLLHKREKTISKSEFFKSLIVMPYTWLVDSNEKRNIEYKTLKISPPIDSDEVEKKFKTIETEIWLTSQIESMLTGITDYSSVSKSLDFEKLTKFLLFPKSTHSCRDILAQSIVKGIMTNSLYELTLINITNPSRKKPKKIKSFIPTYHKEYFTFDENAVSEYKQTLSFSNEELLRRYFLDKQTLLNMIRSEIIKSFIMVFSSFNFYCEIKGSDHFSNHVYYCVNLKTMEWWQGCNDVDCIEIYNTNFNRNHSNNNNTNSSTKTSDLDTNDLGIFNNDDEAGWNRNGTTRTYGGFKQSKAKGQKRPLILSETDSNVVFSYINEKLEAFTGIVNFYDLSNNSPDDNSSNTNVSEKITPKRKEPTKKEGDFDTRPNKKAKKMNNNDEIIDTLSLPSDMSSTFKELFD